jgi:hypothetical protein
VKIYRAEEGLVMSQQTQQRLYQFLLNEGATMVIGHSLGCRLLYETAKQIELPSSVKRVIWVQAGIDVNVRVAGLFPEFINCWCPWDPTLCLPLFFFISDLA